jgi:hypothetical protein
LVVVRPEDVPQYEGSAPVRVLSGQADDPYEPNDSLGQAYSIQLGTTYRSKISRLGDNDYYQFVPGQSGTFRFSMRVPSDKDYDVRLLNSAGQVLGERRR